MVVYQAHAADPGDGVDAPVSAAIFKVRALCVLP